MTRYPAWQAPYRSFYSLDFYRDVAANWHEIGFVYVLCIVAFSSFCFAALFQLTVAPSFDKVILPVAEQWPTITAEDGKFSIDKDSPYKVKDAAGNTIVFFDMTGTSQPEGVVLMSSDKIRLLQSDRGPSDWIEAKDWPFRGTCTTKMVVDCVKTVRDWGAVTIFTLGFLVGALQQLFAILFFGAVGLIFSAIMNANLKYSQLARLAALAITPMWLLDIVLKLALTSAMSLPLVSLLFGGLKFAVSLTYLGLAVNACKRLNQPPEPDAAPVPPPEAPPATA
jgi:hypothetical protein